jgi:hypothetical protein
MEELTCQLIQRAAALQACTSTSKSDLLFRPPRTYGTYARSLLPKLENALDPETGGDRISIRRLNQTMANTFYSAELTLISTQLRTLASQGQIRNVDHESWTAQTRHHLFYLLDNPFTRFRLHKETGELIEHRQPAEKENELFSFMYGLPEGWGTYQTTDQSGRPCTAYQHSNGYTQWDHPRSSAPTAQAASVQTGDAANYFPPTDHYPHAFPSYYAGESSTVGAGTGGEFSSALRPEQQEYAPAVVCSSGPYIFDNTISFSSPSESVNRPFSDSKTDKPDFSTPDGREKFKKSLDKAEYIAFLTAVNKAGKANPEKLQRDIYAQACQELGWQWAC